VEFGYTAVHNAGWVRCYVVLLSHACVVIACVMVLLSHAYDLLFDVRLL
jgi:hypothetical protein